MLLPIEAKARASYLAHDGGATAWSSPATDHGCAALADPKILGDLVEADGIRTEKQTPIEPGGDGWYAS
jgi:hypothetical protein